MVESTLAVDMNTSLSDATEIAWKQLELTELVALSCVRLVKYDALHDYIDRSFDESELSQPIHKVLGGVRFIYSFDLLLEIKLPQHNFDSYKPGGVNVKVYVVDLSAELISQTALTVRVYLQQTVAVLKSQIVEHLTRSSSLTVSPNLTCVLDFHSDLRQLNDDERTLKSIGFGKNNKVFVEPSGSENNSEDFTETCLYKLLDRINNTININIHLPDTASQQANNSASWSDVTSPQSLQSLAASDATSLQRPAACDVDSLGTRLWGQSLSDNGDNWLKVAAEKSCSSMNHSLHTSSDRHSRYFAVSTANSHCLKVSVDKRITIKSLKHCLQPFVGITADNFDLYRVLSNGDELEMKRIYETMSLYDNQCDFRVKLGRCLKAGEYRLNVYLFNSTDKKPVKFLMEAAVSQGMSVYQLKQTIVDELHSKQQFIQLTIDRCRLRKKSYKSPSTIYSNDEIFDVDGINVVSNMDIFLEILNGVDTLRVDCACELSVYVRHWRPSSYQLDSIIELFVDEDSTVDLINKFSVACQIAADNLEIAKMSGSYPCDISVFDIDTGLLWHSPDVTPGCCLKSLGVYTDGAMFCCRDKTESCKVLSDEERKVLEQAENSRFLLSSSTFSHKTRTKERALKIYTSDEVKCENHL